MCGAWEGVGLWFTAVPLLVLGGAVMALVLRIPPRRDPEDQKLPEDALRARYAAGSLSRQQYLEALVGVLQGRYIRGEVGLDVYEERVTRLLAPTGRQAPHPPAS